MTITPLLAAALTAGPLTVAAGGDVLLGRGVERYLEVNGTRALDGMAVALGGADLALVNLEGPPSRCEAPEPRRYPLHADPRRVALLRAAHVDAVSLANNHALDCGAAGLAEAVALLRAQGIAVAGVEEDGRAQVPVMLERRGRRVGVLAYSAVDDGAWTAHGTRYARLLPRSLDEVRGARSRVDVLVVSVHWGREEAAEPLPGQREWARRLVQAGADLVVGHHAHVLQPSEWMGGGLVLYGLGNLLFDRSGPAGAVARVELGDGAPRLSLVPIRIEGGRVVAGEAVPRPGHGEAPLER